MLKRAMPPAGSNDAVLLILGSLPGDASLQAQRYYAHPHNQFWRLLGDALGEPLSEASYPERLDRLSARGIALWDVVAEAAREGSLDGAMRGVRPNALRQFVASHPRLRTIAFNGQTAARIGRRSLAGIEDIGLIDLPSSSPAFTRPFAAKAAQWAVLGAVALPAEKGRMDG